MGRSPRGLILRQVFLKVQSPIYINDLPKGLSSNAKLFADDTSLFSVIHDSSTTRNELNDDLVKINNLADQWTMIFYPDPIQIPKSKLKILTERPRK